MGLGYHLVEAIAREHRYKPITGDVLFIGRQTVDMPIDGVVQLFDQQGISTKGTDLDSLERDRSTRLALYSSDRDFITDRALIRLLSPGAVVKALDHSAYEGAEVIHDLTSPLPPELAGTAAFVIDGSVLDNVFNPVVALSNFCKLLRPNGRLLMFEAMGGRIPSYINYTPLWFLDYFVINGFTDCQVYMVIYQDTGWLVVTMDLNALLRHRDNNGRCRNFYPNEDRMILVVAEKGPASTFDRIPNQADYRSEEEWQLFERNLLTLLQSERPYLTRSSHVDFPELPVGLKAIGRNYP